MLSCRLWWWPPPLLLLLLLLVPWLDVMALLLLLLLVLAPVAAASRNWPSMWVCRTVVNLAEQSIRATPTATKTNG